MPLDCTRGEPNDFGIINRQQTEREPTMTLWKVYCMEDEFPGLWHRLYRHQCVAVGWPPPRCKLNGKTKDRGLVRVRNALSRMAVGDYVVAALKGNRVGRLGQVTALAVSDKEWDPL